MRCSVTDIGHDNAFIQHLLSVPCVLDTIEILAAHMNNTWNPYLAKL